MHSWRELREDPNFVETIIREALIGNLQSRQKLILDKKGNSMCNYCHQKGHTVKLFRNWISDSKQPKPSDSNKSREGKNNAAANMTLLLVDEEILSVETISENWFIDNGALKHITNSNNCFPDWKSLSFFTI